MRNDFNKEKMGITVRFSIRIPKEQHLWLKEKSNSTKNTGKFISMNDYISQAIELFKEQPF